MLVTYRIRLYEGSRDDRNVYERFKTFEVEIEDPLYADQRIIMKKWKEIMVHEGWSLSSDGELFNDGGLTEVNVLGLVDITNDLILLPSPVVLDRKDHRFPINRRRWREKGINWRMNEHFHEE